MGSDGGADGEKVWGPDAVPGARASYWRDAGRLEALLRAENAARLSPATQDALRKLQAGGGDWIDEMGRMQEDLVRGALPRFARAPNVRERQLWVADGLLALRTAAAEFPHLRGISLWERHNRARQGDLRVGDPLVNCPLIPLVDGGSGIGTQTTLFQVVAGHAGAPLLVLAGSST